MPNEQTRLRLVIATAVAALAALALAPMASAHDAGIAGMGAGSAIDSSGDRCADPTDFVHGACVGDGGLIYYLLPNGSIISTHGPDPDADSLATSPPGLPSGSRDPVCATGGDWRLQVLTAGGSGSTITAGIKRANAFLNTQAIGAGGVSSADFKVACTSTGAIQVTSVSSDLSSCFGSTFQKIACSMQNQGYDDKNTIYWVYWPSKPAENPNVCGEATVGRGSSSYPYRTPPDGPLFAINYQCLSDAAYAATIWLHEATHAMGGVKLDAPNSTGAYHCNDDYDVMCYDDGGAFSVPYLRCGAVQYDCGKDDYFHTTPLSGNYLYTHWNTGSCDNDYLSRSGCITQPQNLTLTSGGLAGSSNTLGWSTPAASGGGLVSLYEVWRASCPVTNTSCRPNNYMRIASTAGRSYSDTPALGNTQTYYYKVRAQNTVGDLSGFSNVVSRFSPL